MHTAATPRWITAFVDVPDEAYEATVRFWAEALGARVSPARGAREEFVTIVPTDGDAVLKVQKIMEGEARVHLDLHVDDVDAAVAQAEGAGGRLLARPEASYAVVASPAGLVHCFVTHDASRRPAPAAGPSGARSALDHLCIDAPSDQHAAEMAYWTALWGWDHTRSEDLPEFGWWGAPDTIPFTVLSQEIGDGPARFHLDLHTSALDGAVDDLRALGAQEAAGGGRFWRVLRDPAGLVLCVVGDPRLTD